MNLLQKQAEYNEHLTGGEILLVIGIVAVTVLAIAVFAIGIKLLINKVRGL